SPRISNQMFAAPRSFAMPEKRAVGTGKALYALHCSVPRCLPPFPTRRSSDLEQGRPAEGEAGPDACVVRSKGCASETHQPHSTADRKSTRLNSSHVKISYAVFCLKKKSLTTSLNSNLSNDEAINLAMSAYLAG